MLLYLSGSSESSLILRNKNQSIVEKKIEMGISTNDKRQKYGKRVRFAIDDNIEHTYRNRKIDELNSKHKDCHLNNLNINSEVDTIQNIKIQPKMLYVNDRYSCNDVDYVGHPSKHRHLSFNRFNYNESHQSMFDCNAIKEYPFLKNIKTAQQNEENLLKFEDQLPRVTLRNDHLIHENEFKIDEVEYKKKFEVTDIVDSIDKNSNNSKQAHNTTNLGFGIRSPTNFEHNGSTGSKSCEESHNASILNITMVKSNLDRIIKRYRMKQKQIKDDNLG